MSVVIKPDAKAPRGGQLAWEGNESKAVLKQAPGREGRIKTCAQDLRDHHYTVLMMNATHLIPSSVQRPWFCFISLLREYNNYSSIAFLNL
jgi:hypothetical protein